MKKHQTRSGRLRSFLVFKAAAQRAGTAHADQGDETCDGSNITSSTEFAFHTLSSGFNATDGWWTSLKWSCHVEERNFADTSTFKFFFESIGNRETVVSKELSLVGVVSELLLKLLFIAFLPRVEVLFSIAAPLEGVEISTGTAEACGSVVRLIAGLPESFEFLIALAIVRAHPLVDSLLVLVIHAVLVGGFASNLTDGFVDGASESRHGANDEKDGAKDKSEDNEEDGEPRFLELGCEAAKNSSDKNKCTKGEHTLSK